MASHHFTLSRHIALRPLLLLAHPAVTVTVWRLKDLAGAEVRCELERHDFEIWQLRIQRGPDLLRLESHTGADAALRRANVLWLDFLLDGWTEP